MKPYKLPFPEAFLCPDPLPGKCLGMNTAYSSGRFFLSLQHLIRKISFSFPGRRRQESGAGRSINSHRTIMQAPFGSSRCFARKENRSRCNYESNSAPGTEDRKAKADHRKEKDRQEHTGTRSAALGRPFASQKDDRQQRNEFRFFAAEDHQEHGRTNTNERVYRRQY